MQQLTKQLLEVKNWIRASGFDPKKKRKFQFYSLFFRSLNYKLIRFGKRNHKTNWRVSKVFKLSLNTLKNASKNSSLLNLDNPEKEKGFRLFYYLNFLFF